MLNAEANVEVDLTALDALDQLRTELASRGIVFAMARVKQDLRDALEAAGCVDKIGEDRIFMTLPTAVEAYRNSRTAVDQSRRSAPRLAPTRTDAIGSRTASNTQPVKPTAGITLRPKVIADALAIA